MEIHNPSTANSAKLASFDTEKTHQQPSTTIGHTPEADPPAQTNSPPPTILPLATYQLTKWLQMIMKPIKGQTKIKSMPGTIQIQQLILAAIPQPLLAFATIPLPPLCQPRPTRQDEEDEVVQLDLIGETSNKEEGHSSQEATREPSVEPQRVTIHINYQFHVVQAVNNQPSNPCGQKRKSTLSSTQDNLPKTMKIKAKDNKIFIIWRVDDNNLPRFKPSLLPEEKIKTCTLVQEDPKIVAQNKLAFRQLRAHLAPNSIPAKPSREPTAGASNSAALHDIIRDLYAAHHPLGKPTRGHDTRSTTCLVQAVDGHTICSERQARPLIGRPCLRAARTSRSKDPSDRQVRAVNLGSAPRSFNYRTGPAGNSTNPAQGRLNQGNNITNPSAGQSNQPTSTRQMTASVMSAVESMNSTGVSTGLNPSFTQPELFQQSASLPPQFYLGQAYTAPFTPAFLGQAFPAQEFPGQAFPGQPYQQVFPGQPYQQQKGYQFPNSQAQGSSNQQTTNPASKPPICRLKIHQMHQQSNLPRLHPIVVHQLMISLRSPNLKYLEQLKDQVSL
ncbi:hypothetical protein MJO29_008318 [Puccinia striiformis f. sp. tritici]|nr:hypothetical protein MJO29_008318 [Puccinia striiformis f. sp. tritici]